MKSISDFSQIKINTKHKARQKKKQFKRKSGNRLTLQFIYSCKILIEKCCSFSLSRMNPNVICFASVYRSNSTKLDSILNLSSNWTKSIMNGRLFDASRFFVTKGYNNAVASTRTDGRSTTLRSSTCAFSHLVGSPFVRMIRLKLPKN